MPIFQIDALKPYNQLNADELEKLTQVQNICDLLLKAVDKICRKYDIKYIFIGSKECEKFPELNHKLLQEIGTVAFSDGVSAYVMRVQ